MKDDVLKAMQDKNEYRDLMWCYCKKPELIKEYPLVEEDKADLIYWYIYEAIEKLAQQGYKDIGVNEVETILKDYYPSKYNIYQKCNGNNVMTMASQTALVDNIQSYYASVKKYTILRQLYKKGIDISEYYGDCCVDPDEAEKAVERFLLASPNDIITFYEDKFSEMLKDIRKTNKDCLTDILEIYNPMDLPNAEVIKKPIIEGMMLENTMNNIIAPPKAGKSFFSYQMASCVQNGTPFMGRKTDKKDVLYVDFELRNDAIKERCEKLKVFYDNENLEHFNILPLSATWGDADVTLDSIVRKVKDYKKVNPNLGLVIFDCYYRFAEGDENSAEDTMATLSKLKMLTGDMSVVYVHHTNKSSGGKGNTTTDILNKGSGSGVHGRVVDQTYYLDPKKDGIHINNTGRDWYNDEFVCKRDESGYFVLDDAETQALNGKRRVGIPQKKKSALEELKESYPDAVNYILENQKDGYGVRLKNITDFFNDTYDTKVTVTDLKNFGFIYTGKNKNEDGTPSGRIMLP